MRTVACLQTILQELTSSKIRRFRTSKGHDDHMGHLLRGLRLAKYRDDSFMDLLWDQMPIKQVHVDAARMWQNCRDKPENLQKVKVHTHLCVDLLRTCAILDYHPASWRLYWLDRWFMWEVSHLS